MKSIVKKVLCCLLVVVVLVGCFFAVDAYCTHKAREKVVIEFADWSEEEIAKLHEHHKDGVAVDVKITFDYPRFRMREKGETKEEYNILSSEYYSEKNQQMSQRLQIPLERFSEISGNAYFFYKTTDEFYKDLDYFYSLAEDSNIIRINVCARLLIYNN